ERSPRPPGRVCATSPPPMSSSAFRRAPARPRPGASSSTWTAQAAGVDRTRMGDMTEPRLDRAHRARCARQIRLAGFGEPAQASLLESHVRVIGAGGLGAPVLSYLAALGGGTISVIDPAIVELSSRHRQVIHTEAAVGARKVVSARERMS